MKKIALILCVLMLTATGAFATQQYFSTGSVSVGGGTETDGDTADMMNCGLSANVTAMYEDSDTTQTQWYAIGTFHTGGTEVYATAQDVTSIYKLDAGKQPGSSETTLFNGIPAASDESTVWSEGAWTSL